MSPDRRGQLIVEYTEMGNRAHDVMSGQGRIDGTWVHWYDPEIGFWQSWPQHNVVCITWNDESAG